MGTPAVKAEAVSPPMEKRPQLQRGAARLEEQCRRRWFMIAPPGCTKEDGGHPSFWAAVAPKLNRHDVVHLLAHDESWELEYRVERVRQDGCDVTLSKAYTRHPVALTSTALGPDHHTEWRADHGWCVVRNSDGHPIIAGHALEGGAINEFWRTRPRNVA